MSKRRQYSSPVKVMYLPGFEPPPKPKKPSSWQTKLPFVATITAKGETYRVEVGETGMRFLGWT